MMLITPSRRRASSTLAPAPEPPRQPPGAPRMKVKQLAVAAVTLALAAAVAAPGTAHATPPSHCYPPAAASQDAVKLSHLKTDGACAWYARSKFPDNEPSDVPSGHKLDG